MVKLLFLNFVMVVSSTLHSEAHVISGEETILSGEKHFEKNRHNAKYDHEAFLGKEEAKEFDDYTEEESKAKLSEIFDNVDTNADGLITDIELRKWIRYTHIPIVINVASEQLELYDTNHDGYTTFDEYTDYLITTYTKLGHKVNENDFKNKIQEKRFIHADTDNDGKLNVQELASYLYPAYFDNMKDAVLELKLKQFDATKDGLISEEEYKGFKWFGEQGKNFKDYDKNKDGQLDKDEISDWVSMSDFVVNEALHLIQEADENKDKMLSKKEVLDNYDLFVGSKTKYKDVHGLLDHSIKFRNEL